MDLTVVLVGPTGHGKSATGNTILGREAFTSRARSSRVTETCELQTSVLEDGGTISVIDTPGFVDTESELPGEEVKKCFHLARNRIHAIAYVVSIGCWFFKADQTVAVRNLQTIFGENIINHMIVVFTGGDEADALFFSFENHYMTRLCEGRYVRFDNNTKDEVQRYEQIQNLLSQVKTVISHNGGKPFMSQVFELQLQTAWKLRDNIAEAQAATLTVDEGAKGYLKEEILEQIDKSFEERMTQITDVVESTVRYATTRLEQRLVEAQATTMNSEEISKLIQQLNKSNQEVTTQRIDAVEARLRDTTTSLEQQMEAATLKADERSEKYFKESTLELNQQISKSYEEQMTQRLVEAHATTMNANKEQTTQRIDAVEARLRDTTTSLEQQMEVATMKANERAEKYFKEATSELIQQISISYEEQMTQRLEAVEQRVLDTATRFEQQLAEAHAAQMKVNEIARQQMTQRINAEVEQRVLDMATRLEQQQAEAHAAQMKVNEIVQQRMAQRINEEVESRVKDVTTRLEQQLAEAEAARLKADKRAQEAQKNSDEQSPKPYWRFGVQSFMFVVTLVARYPE